jgi:hypothetical protein
MKPLWVRWTIRTVLGCVVLLGVGFAALFIRNPDAARFLLVVLMEPLIGNASPPAIARDELAGLKWWNEPEGGRRLTEVLQRKFPTGASEATLKSTLANQGFRQLPLPPTDCVPPGQPTTVGSVLTPCPKYDPSRILRYEWGSGFCRRTITVLWAADNRNDITQAYAVYYTACLFSPQG